MTRNESHHSPEMGKQVSDELMTTTPVARAAFRDSLEQQLIAQMYTESEASMTTQTLTDERALTGRRTFLPLTLAAAMICVMIATGLLLVEQRPSPINSMVSLQTQGEATPGQISHIPSDLRPVVIAVTTIPRGSLLRADQLTVAYFPTDQMPGEGFTDVDTITDWIAQDDIVRWQPVTSGTIAQTQPEDRTTSAVVLPSDRVAVAIPTNQLSEGGDQITEGMLLRISAALDVNALPAHTEIPDALLPAQESSTVVRQITSNALVINQGTVGKIETVTVAVNESEAALLVWLLDNNVQIIASTGIIEVNNPEIAQGIPAGYEIVIVPIDRIASAAYGIQAGDRVDVIAALLYVDADEVNGESQFQIPLASGTPLPTTDESITPRVTLQRIFSGAIVAGFETESQAGRVIPVVQLAVPSEAARTLTWFAETKAPVMLVPICGCGG